MPCSRVWMFNFHGNRNSKTCSLPLLVSVLSCFVLTTKAFEINLGLMIISPTTEQFMDKINSSIDFTRSEFANTVIENADIHVTVYNFTDEINFVTEVPSLFASQKHQGLIVFTPQRYISMLGRFSQKYQTPLIIADNYYQYTDSDYIVSMFNSFELTSEAMIEYLEWFQWGTVAVLSTNHIYWKQMATSLENRLMKQSFHIKYSDTIENISSSEEVSILLKQITPDAKAVILTMNPDEAVVFMEICRHEPQLLQSHAFFLVSNSPHVNHSAIFNDVTMTQNTTQNTNPMESLFILCPKVPKYSSISRRRRSTIQTTVMEAISSLEDAIATVFQAIVVVTNNTETNFSRSNLMEEIKQSKLATVNKHVIFNSNTHRIFDFSLLDFNLVSESFQEVRYITLSSTSAWIRYTTGVIQWPNNLALTPDACFKNINCDSNSINIIAATVSPLVLVLIGGIVAVVVYIIWRRRTKILMTKGPNKILLEQADVVYLHRHDVKTTKSQTGTFLEKPDILKKSDKPNRSLASLQENAEFSEIARYKGDTVYLKELHTKGLEVKGKLLSCLRSLRDTRQENINPLYGFLMDQIRPSLVYEYCSRGSLEDVIKSETLKLDWDFKLSLLTDLVRGVRYIQSSPIHYHGSLKSRNCVIDSRWVLKLTDFGINQFREIAKVTVDNDARDLLWTAPEHLRGSCPGMKGSEKGDMYGFAIIMQEVILRSAPFSMTGLKPEEIIKKISHPPPLLRPSVSPQAAQPQYIQIMKQCWAENPDIRPGIEDVYHQFKAISGGKKMNIVDSMFRMLEKYSTDLEDIVKDRTAELEIEKKKTDLLLCRMLPKTVADSLKIGRPVEAEEYSEVTIYFSDIVGFTTISAMSNPMEVVALLNDLYSMFDATIDNYDVYKVETIGDAYMVASGLPVPNGIRHAGEIGTMALDLLSQCGTFTIRHMPDVPLRLRIGLHTGPCVAGVVGLTMPRYCLFGDTVNTASRMESSGSAFRIHISNDTKGKLDELGGYNVEFRGEVELKGKGLAKTYWLVGKEGFHKPLPEPPEQTSGSNHGLESLINKASERRDTALKAPVPSLVDTSEKISPKNCSDKTPSENENKKSNSKPEVGPKPSHLNSRAISKPTISSSENKNERKISQNSSHLNKTSDNRVNKSSLTDTNGNVSPKMSKTRNTSTVQSETIPKSDENAINDAANQNIPNKENLSNDKITVINENEDKFIDDSDERHDKVSSSECTITIISGSSTPRSDCQTNSLTTVAEA